MIFFKQKAGRTRAGRESASKNPIKMFWALKFRFFLSSLLPGILPALEKAVKSTSQALLPAFGRP
jgi:hypothetical protein